MVRVSETPFFAGSGRGPPSIKVGFSPSVGDFGKGLMMIDKLIEAAEMRAAERVGKYMKATVQNRIIHGRTISGAPMKRLATKRARRRGKDSISRIAGKSNRFSKDQKRNMRRRRPLIDTGEMLSSIALRGIKTRPSPVRKQTTVKLIVKNQGKARAKVATHNSGMEMSGHGVHGDYNFEIPARPFWGLNRKDIAVIKRIYTEELGNAVTKGASLKIFRPVAVDPVGGVRSLQKGVEF